VSSHEWMAIRNWRRFQNYSDRNPPWVKWHTAQLEDDELRSMKPMTRLFWSQLVLVSSRKENVIPNDSAWLAQETAMSRQAVTSSVKELEQAGFLRFFASKEACRDASDGASTTRDTRTETKEQEQRQEPSRVVDVARPHFVPSGSDSEQDTNSTSAEEARAALARLSEGIGRPF
jgi:hypothetical protein